MADFTLKMGQKRGQKRAKNRQKWAFFSSWILGFYPQKGSIFVIFRSKIGQKHDFRQKTEHQSAGWQKKAQKVAKNRQKWPKNDPKMTDFPCFFDRSWSCNAYKMVDFTGFDFRQKKRTLGQNRTELNPKNELQSVYQRFETDFHGSVLSAPLDFLK